MPLIRMRTTACGPDGVWMADSIHDVPVETAKLYVESQAAVYCNTDGTERAVMAAIEEEPETATMKTRKGSK